MKLTNLCLLEEKRVSDVQLLFVLLFIVKQIVIIIDVCKQLQKHNTSIQSLLRFALQAHLEVICYSRFCLATIFVEMPHAIAGLSAQKAELVVTAVAPHPVTFCSLAHNLIALGTVTL